MATRVKNAPTTVLYLYGISKTSGAEDEAISGVDGESLIEAVPCAGLICWVSRVSKADFADHLARNIEDLDWLAEMSTRHQAAVSAIAASRDLLPARFATVFLTESSLRADVESRRTQLNSDFKRIAGSEEWGVKVFAKAPEAVKLGPVKTGKDYLRAKSALLQQRAPRQADDSVQRFAGALEKLCVAIAEGGKIAGGRRDLLYHVSLLLKRAQRKKLENLVQSFARQWKDSRRIECTGPWPPYSFVSRRVD